MLALKLFKRPKSFKIFYFRIDHGKWRLKNEYLARHHHGEVRWRILSSNIRQPRSRKSTSPRRCKRRHLSKIRAVDSKVRLNQSLNRDKQCNLNPVEQSQTLSIPKWPINEIRSDRTSKELRLLKWAKVIALATNNIVTVRLNQENEDFWQFNSYDVNNDESSVSINSNWSINDSHGSKITNSFCK
jgi:hypothetical protein